MSAGSLRRVASGAVVRRNEFLDGGGIGVVTCLPRRTATCYQLLIQPILAVGSRLVRARAARVMRMG